MLTEFTEKNLRRLAMGGSQVNLRWSSYGKRVLCYQEH